MLVLVADDAEAVASADIEARDLLRCGHRFGERAQGCRRTALPGSDRFDLQWPDRSAARNVVPRGG